jgi:rare lipoprotein A
MASPSTFRHRLAVLLLGALLLAGIAATLASRAGAATGIAGLAAQLARDADDLAGARADLHDVREELDSIRDEHRRLRVEVEDRLVAIYKYGGGGDTIERVAAGESVADVGRSLDALDVVARYDERLLVRWQELDRRRTELLRRQRTLQARIVVLQDRVQRSREALSAAEAHAAAARRDAERMSRNRQNPLLPRVANPVDAALEEGGVEVSADQPIGFTQSGMASFYHDSFAGEHTSNGETYDPNAFTAAHPSLPFGTWVTVTGPAGSVQVRINDRGPFVGGRIIDLSRAAAQAIGVTLSPVTISVTA